MKKLRTSLAQSQKPWSEIRVNDFRVSQDFWLYDFESPDTHEVIVSSKLISICQRLVYAFGPIIITSAYRTLKHNKKVGGAKHSYHLLGLAADPRPEKKHPTLLMSMFRIVASWSDVGGLGIYESGIIHIDLRPSKAFWCKPLKKNYRYFETAANTLGFYRTIVETQATS